MLFHDTIKLNMCIKNHDIMISNVFLQQVSTEITSYMGLSGSLKSTCLSSCLKSLNWQFSDILRVPHL